MYTVWERSHREGIDVSTKKRTRLYILGGTVLEHMDNILFTLYLPLLAGVFFGVNDVKTQWFLGFIAFSLYALFRPLGSLLIGVISDRYGRRTALLWSISMMSLATIGLGLTPSYASWGMAASVLFLGLRILQGLSVGGEYATAMTYIFESTKPDKHTVSGGVLIASTHLGGALASLLSYFYPHHFRSIFIGAGIIGLLSLLGRLSLLETTNSTDRHALSFADYTKKGNLKAYTKVGAAAGCLVFCYWTLTIYCNKISQQLFAVPLKSIFFINFLVLALWVITTPLIGYWIDLKGYSAERVSKIGSTCMMIAAVPCFWMVEKIKTVEALVVVQLLLSFFHIIFCVATPKMMCYWFSKKVRNAHLALSFSLGSCLAGSLTPVLNGFAFEKGSFLGLGVLLILIAGLGFYGVKGEGEKNK